MMKHSLPATAVTHLAAVLLASVASAQALSWQQIHMTGEGECGNTSGPPITELAAGADGYLYFSTPGSLLRSPDGGLTWERPAFQPYHITAIVPFRDDTLLIGVYGPEGGLFRIAQHGDLWEATNLNHSVWEVTAYHGAIYAVVHEQGLLASQDGGSTWERKDPGWEVRSLRIGPSGHLYVVTNSGVYTLGEESIWKELPSETLLPYPIPEPDRLLASDSTGVYLSADNGAHWDLVLEQPSVLFVTNQEDAVLALTRSGALFVTRDRGETWTGLANAFLTGCDRAQVAVVDKEGHVVVGTVNGVLYRSIETTLTDTEEQVASRHFALSANYPNPVQTMTVIPYQIDRLGQVRVTIYDILGREVEELVSELLAPGQYEVRWEVSGLRRGLYFCRMETAGETVMRAITVLR